MLTKVIRTVEENDSAMSWICLSIRLVSTKWTGIRYRREMLSM